MNKLQQRMNFYSGLFLLLVLFLISISLFSKAMDNVFILEHNITQHWFERIK